MLGKFPGAKRPKKGTDTSALHLELIKELTQEAHPGRRQDDVDILQAMWEVLKGCIEQGRMNGGGPYELARGRVPACSRNQCVFRLRGGLDQTVSEGFMGTSLCSEPELALVWKRACPGTASPPQLI